MLYKKEESYGKSIENKTKPIIEHFLNTELENTEAYNCFDFINTQKKILVELKSRRNLKNTYPTTMIGYNKVKKAKGFTSQGWSVYMFFKFTDGLYYIKYNDELEYEIRKGYRNDRPHTVMNPQDYCYINVNRLIQVEI